MPQPRKRILIFIIKKNNASFIAEVEEFAKWAELVFMEYCGIAGFAPALFQFNKNIRFYDCGDGFSMPKIIIKRRSCLERTFRERFENCKDLDVIEILKLRYYMPSTEDLQLDIPLERNIVCGAALVLRMIITKIFT